VSNRPDELAGSTYKIKPPNSDHALYMTINNAEGRPFEVFFNTKNAAHYQWMVALSCTITAVFRSASDARFLIDQLKAVHDPRGGYFERGKYVPSLIAKIGSILEHHYAEMGLLEVDTSLAEAAKAMVAEKTQKTSGFNNAILCAKCHTLAVVMMDGCLTCTNCGDSKCS
jgi:hypothetical protein